MSSKFRVGQKVTTMYLRNSYPNDEMKQVHRDGELLTIEAIRADGAYCSHPSFSGDMYEYNGKNCWFYHITDLAFVPMSMEELDTALSNGEISDEEYLNGIIEIRRS